MPRTVKNIKGAVGYQNPKLVERYASRHNVDIAYASLLFEEMKRFLVTGALMEQPCSPSKELDEMWHHFILHTGPYAEWCEQHIGWFIHHNPTETPYIGNRQEMLETATALFEDLNLSIWPKVHKAECKPNCNGSDCAEIIACNGSCDGDNYCSEDIARRPVANHAEIVAALASNMA